jgi:hypothetical protein
VELIQPINRLLIYDCEVLGYAEAFLQNNIATTVNAIMSGSASNPSRKDHPGHASFLLQYLRPHELGAYGIFATGGAFLRKMLLNRPNAGHCACVIRGFIRKKSIPS